MTKTLSIALAAIIGTASLATADSYLAIDNDQQSRSYLSLDNVTADGAGTIEIFDFHTGRTGALLGTESVAAGANRDVRINLGSAPSRDVIAVLTVNGQVVDEEKIDLR